MKASALVKLLKKAIEDHGDLEVIAHDGGIPVEMYSIDSVELDTKTSCCKIDYYLHLNKGEK